MKKINERQETEIIDAEAVKRLVAGCGGRRDKSHRAWKHMRDMDRIKRSRHRENHHMVMQTTEVRHRSGQVRPERHSPKRGPAPKKA